MLISMTVEIPPYHFFLWPALQAVIALGGSASIAELDTAVIDRENLSPEVQSVLHGDGPMTEVQYRLAWARTYLKGMGLLTNSQRGVWSVTELGETVAEDQIPTLRVEWADKLPMDHFDIRPSIQVTRSWKLADAVAQDSTGQFIAEVREPINQVLAALDEPQLEDIQPHSPDVSAVNTLSGDH